MSSVFSTAGLARRSGSRPWLVVAAWVLVMVLAGALIPRLSDALTSDTTFTNNPESVQGFNALEDAGLRDDDEFNETIVIRSGQFTVDSPEFQAVVSRATDAARGVTEWVDPNSVFNYYEATAAGAPEAAALVSEDRHATIIPVTLLPGVVDEPAPYLDAIHEQAKAADGFELLTVGTMSINEEFNTIAEEDLAKGEGIGGIFALIVLVFVFGALLAAFIPIILAVAAIFISLGLTAALGYFFDLSFFITNMITMIGLAVGIDYALFVVERYREERRRGLPKLDAIEFAGATANRAVFFSGMTVILALVGMFLVPTTIFRSLAVGAILVVIVAVAATLTLIPAVLALLGDKIDWPRRRKYDASTVALQAQYDHETIHSGFWGRVTKVVMARPMVAVVATVILLLAAAAPLLNINTGFAGVETLPEGDSRRAFEILSEDFSAGRLAPIEIVVEGSQAEVGAQIDELTASLNSSGLYSNVAPPLWSENGEVALVEATLMMQSERRCRLRRGRSSARQRCARRLRRQRRRCVGHRRHCLQHRLLRHDQHVHADRLRLRSRPELPAPDDRLPLDHPAAQGDHPQPALRRRGLRSDGPGLPGGCRRRSIRLPGDARPSRPGSRSSSSRSCSA